MDTEQFQLKSKSFFIHPEYKTIKDAHNFDVCLIQTSLNEHHITYDLSSNFQSMPCIPDHIDLQKVFIWSFQLIQNKKLQPFFKEHGKLCWVAGWGQSQSNGVSSEYLKAIGINLMKSEYCLNHR